MGPLTANCPKPLLDVGGKPIVEYSIQRLIQAGVRDFTFCINYLGEMIRDHFGTGEAWSVAIDYIQEQKPLGTLGGACLKSDYKFEDLLIINGDLLTSINFEKFYRFFIEQDADMAVATIPYRTNLPYGILDQNEDHQVTRIQEKPTYTHHINTGIYFIRKELLDQVPLHQHFDAVELIEIALKSDKKVSAFPLLDYWMDIGQIEDYHKAQEDIQYLYL